jgi:hypothetical protein
MNTDYWLALDKQHMTFAELIPVSRFHRSLLEPRVDSASGCEQTRSKLLEFITYELLAYNMCSLSSYSMSSFDMKVFI